MIASGDPADAGRADWTHIDADGGRSHVNKLEQRLGRSTAERLRVDWRRTIRPVQPFFWEYGIAPKLVSASRVFAVWSAAESRDHLDALDEATGDRLWRRRFDGYPEPIATDAGAVYVGLQSTIDKAMALSVEDGETLWARRHIRPFAADSAATRLFAVQASDHDRRVIAIDSATGLTLWASDLDPRTDASQPLVSRGLVVVAARTTPRTIVALRADDGTQVWSAKMPGWLSVAAGGRVFTIRWIDPPTGAAIVDAVDLRDGTELWSRRLPTQAWIGAATPGKVFVDRAVCVRGCEGDAFGQHRGGVVALDARTGTRIWSVLGDAWGGDPLWQTGAVANGLVFVYRFELGNAAFGALDTTTGRVRWSRSIGGPQVFANLDLVANGAVLGGTYWGGEISGMIVRYALPAAA
jgi:outer membrane protein assembly factor BamB